MSLQGACLRGERPLSALLADWFYGGDETGDEVGYAVGHAGDVNGDGYGDVVVGAPHDRPEIVTEGAAVLFHGGPGGLGIIPDWEAGGGQSGSLFGAAVAGAGDVNGDGFDDLLVGAPGYNDGVNKKGAAFLFFGASYGLEANPAWSLIGDQKDSLLGAAVAGVGDVNGDGFDDFAIGAPRQSLDEEGEGAVFFFFGSDEPLLQVPDWSYYGGQAAAGLGTSLAAAGDVAGDGYDDVLVGAPGYYSDYDDEGAVLLFLGAETGLAPSPGWQALGGQEDALLGTSVAGAGDVDGDGYDDLLAGAPGYASAEVVTGAAILFYGSDPMPDSTARQVVRGGQPASGFGHAVAGAGDVNGDSYDDVVVGAHMYTGDQRAEGAVFIFFGSASGLSGQPGWQAEGDKADTEFGHAVGLAANLREGSLASIVAGAPRYRQGTEPEGRAFVFYGPLHPRYGAYLPLIQNEGP